MAVRIRLKKMGRLHRPFYRLCAMDIRRPRDGRILEELGTYDPLIPETDARAMFNGERIKYWLSVGAKPSDKAQILIKKYGPDGTHADQQKAALARLAESRRRAPPPPPVQKPKPAPQANAEETPPAPASE